MAKEVLLNIKELSDYLPDKPAKNTIYAWVTRGQIPFVKIGKKLFFKQHLIDEWNEKRINK